MKWTKFVELSRQHRWLEHLVGFSLQGPISINGGLKNTVRTKIGYIAIRPFESLNLDTTHTSEGRPVTQDPRYKHVVMEQWTSVQYSIYFHINGAENPERIAFPDGKLTLKQEIEARREWYQGCEAFKDTSLVFDRVVKRTQQGSTYSGLTNVTFEIYEFPIVGWGMRHPLRTPEPQMDPYEKECRLAYLEHRPMPPIRPGIILNTKA